MAERYSRLYSLPENQYAVGAPILIAAGALLKDNQTGKALAQIKFRSISDKQIKAVKISVAAFDVSGKEVEGVPEYQYLDLNVIRNTEFGQKQAVTLPDAVTRSFVVKCTDVFFADGTAWAAAPEAHWDVLPRLETITDKLGSLADQYQRDTSTRSRFAPVEYHDLWFCSCGALNHDGETECHACRQEKEKLFTAWNLEALDQRNEEYKAAEAEKAAKKAEADKIRRNKSKKFALIAAAIIAVIVAVSLLTTKVIIPNTKYNNAVALMEAGQYEEAIAAFEALDGYKDSADKASSCYHKFLLEKLKIAKVGDYVIFGTYEQDNNTSNGKEHIEWLILEIKDGKALLISKYALDCKQYNTSSTDVTWETCTLRKWLNNDFISAAFSADEKAMIPTVTVSADKNPNFSTNPGNATQDQLFLLSITEANKYLSSDSARKGEPTDYAIANGTHRGCHWWLRSPGDDPEHAATGDINGVFVYGFYVNYSTIAVRPALWIDMNS